MDKAYNVMDQQFKDGPAFSKFLDNNDPLGHLRQRFYIRKNTIYMCGNSLGLISKDAEDTTLDLIQKWKNEGVQIWNVEENKYYLYSSQIAKLMAPLVGADDDEIAVVGSTTVNIHQVIGTFYKPTKDRYKILLDDLNFPTDRYAIDSQVRLKGYTPEESVKIVKSVNKFINENDVIAAMTDDVAIVFLPSVYYRTAQILDMKKITDAAKARGIIVGWDLCHAVGAIEVDLKSIDADFAVWCTYKYLNGGPGSCGALYINRKHFQLLPGLAGWFGNRVETQFLLRQKFDHRKDSNGWQIGTPHLFSMAPLEGSLKMFIDCGMRKVRQKSLKLTGYLIYLIDNKLIQFGFSIGNLREDSKRGGHVCLEHEESYRISLALKERGVVPDFRDPNVIRLAPVAMYTTYSEVYTMVEVLVDIMKSESYKKFSCKRNVVV
ncbi:kynureninase-like [Colias croceus]|uniref:kynureninase-like n=1 Tax=Colias crocea TaxID=72248 RepID=UPI001E27F81A|nr:kynureninase-like [Colias croceus]